MMKLIGTVMIAISAVAFGALRRLRLKKRFEALTLFSELVGAYRLELKWRGRTFDEIVKEKKSRYCTEYLDSVRIRADTASQLDTYIEDNAEFGALCLGSDDVSVLRFFFSELGKGNSFAEIELCERTLSALNAACLSAEEELKKQGPLAVKLGILCGVWLIIMLL